MTNNKLPPLTFSTVISYARQQLNTIQDFALFTSVCSLLGVSSYLSAKTSVMMGEVVEYLGNTLVETSTNDKDDESFHLVHYYVGLVGLQALLYVANVYLHQIACDTRTSNEQVTSLQHLLSLDQSYRDAHTLADVENTMQVSSIHRFFCWNIPYLLCLTFEAILIFVYMAQLHLPITLGLYITFGIVQRYILQPFFHLQQTIQEKRRINQIEADRMTKEAYMMFSTIKLFGTEEQHIDEYRRVQASIQTHIEPIVRLRCIREFIEKGISAGLLYMIVTSGVHKHVFCQLTSREWTSFFVLLQQHQSVFAAFQWHWGVLINEYPNMYWYLERRKLHTQNDHLFKTQIRRTTDGPNELLIENVYFSYPRAPKTTILHGISCHCLPGTMTAFIGPSGAGKSTLLKLMSGLYTPTDGMVTIDGVPVASMTPMERSKVLAIVPQQPLLFRRSLRDNLLYGHSEAATTATNQFLEAILAKVHCTHLVSKLDEVVSSESLSAGQSQRVAIARAILRDARIFILDEVTSALDTENQHHMQSLIESFVSQEGKTVIVVTHHLDTVHHATNIVWVENGTVLEQGTHDELLQLKGMYASAQPCLHNIQKI